MARISIVFYALLCFGIAHAQKEIECQTKLSYFHEKVKVKKYDEAYDDWLYVKSNCPSLSLAIYSDGEKILEHKVKHTEGVEKKGFIADLMALWNDRKQYFESRTPKGEFAAKSCQLQYDHKEELGKNNNELFDCFDRAFKADRTTFTHPKSLYTYFFSMVELFDDEKKSAAELFNVYDDVNEKIEVEIQNYSEKLNALVAKLENRTTLTGKEIRTRKAYESYLKNYALIKDNIDAIVDKKAKCENLIPLYLRDFENHQNDSIWLKRSVSRMYHKQCTDDALYEKLVKQYDKVAPSADTKLYVATVLLKKGKDEEAYQYLEEAFRLETRSYKKSKIAYRIGVILMNKNQFVKARNYLVDALKLNPSNGKPHSVVAHMYAESAKNKNCGEDNFYQRAVYWLAAEEVKKASRIDPTLQKLVNQYVASYIAKAPTKEEVFLKGLGGKTIQIKCWINRSVVVPKP